MATVYEERAKVFKALCDERRQKILELLQGGEKCACVQNDAACLAYAEQTIRQLWEDDRVRRASGLSMGSEDFGEFTQRVPGAKVSITTGHTETIHTPQFRIDEGMLPWGAAFFAALCLNKE